MKKKICVLLSLIMTLSLAACGNSAADTGSSSVSGTQSSPPQESGESTAAAEEDLGYTYGETFYSDEPVTYTMFWSDHEAYPYTDSWEIFDKIQELTNVTIDFKDYMIARTDYDEKKSLMINSGQSAYIIPKTYVESTFVDGGAIVAVSDWTEYMPNFTNFVEKYEMEPDLATMRKADGKFYRLPGLHEAAAQDYTLIVRKDIFDAAGVDVTALEKDWTWEDLYDSLVTVKEYMVAEGMCAAGDYIWSDRWPGDDGSGGNLLKLMGSTYGVPAGWAISPENGMTYDAESDSWYFAPISEDYKEFVTMLNKFIKGGLLDPETFTQTDEQACQTFYRGDTVLIGTNKSVYADYLANLDSTLGAGNYELYITVYPKGSASYTAENQRLENGVMIASKALEELGEEGFIKMMRFVDWLFYSDEAYDLTKWGVEGETYEVVTDSGMEIKQLLPQWYCGGLAIPQTSDDQKDMRIELGYAGGVFYYGGTTAQSTDAYSPELQDYFRRSNEYRDLKPLNPAVAGNEDENEQINLWKTPLIDNVNSWSLQFATGQKDIEADWDTYVNSCKNLMCDNLADLYNEIYNR